MEVKMLRWMAGVTRLNRVCIQDIRQGFDTAPMMGKLRKARLRWYGQVLRVDNDSVCKIDVNLTVTGKRPKKND
ncbi:hypothetical protein Y032_0049g1837 [Ancylostoma ceylanicum]|uniref:Reverse transcriptase domain-containing protein n=1 Tax=Ancylostoma ceylanicum TaxID=53326 RepID=A0A016UAM3_9BILA|nr:hypothetical protein Y032_0049g1837 [Ancylostoma ceylanicum]